MDVERRGNDRILVEDVRQISPLLWCILAVLVGEKPLQVCGAVGGLVYTLGKISRGEYDELRLEKSFSSLLSRKEPLF